MISNRGLLSQKKEEVGCVSIFRDPRLAEDVWKIEGVPQTNYLRAFSFCEEDSFVILELRSLGPKAWMICLEVIADLSEIPVFISLGNSGPWCLSERENTTLFVNGFADGLTTLWTVLSISLKDVVKELAGREFLKLKAVRICGSCEVRGVWSSNSKIGNETELPNDLQLPAVPQGLVWTDIYKWFEISSISKPQKPQSSSTSPRTPKRKRKQQQQPEQEAVNHENISERYSWLASSSQVKQPCHSGQTGQEQRTIQQENMEILNERDMIQEEEEEEIQPIKIPTKKSSIEPIAVLKGHTDDIAFIALSSANNEIMASSSCDKTLRIWNLSSFQVINSFSTEDVPLCICFHPFKPKELICGNFNGSISVLDLEKKKIIASINFESDSPILRVCFCYKILFAWSLDGVITALDSEKNYKINTIFDTRISKVPELIVERGMTSLRENGILLFCVGEPSEGIVAIRTEDFKEVNRWIPSTEENINFGHAIRLLSRNDGLEFGALTSNGKLLIFKFDRITNQIKLYSVLNVGNDVTDWSWLSKDVVVVSHGNECSLFFISKELHQPQKFESLVHQNPVSMIISDSKQIISASGNDIFIWKQFEIEEETQFQEQCINQESETNDKNEPIQKEKEENFESIAQKQKELKRIPLPERHYQINCKSKPINFNPKLVLGINEKCSKAIWNTRSGTVLFASSNILIEETIKTGMQRFFFGHSKTISAIALTGNGNFYASGSECDFSRNERAEIIIFDSDSGSKFLLEPFHLSSIQFLDFVGDFLISCGNFQETKLALWNSNDGSLLSSICFNHPIHCISIINESSFIIGGDYSLIFISTKDRKLQIERNADLSCISKEKGIHITALENAGDHLFVASFDGNSSSIAIFETKSISFLAFIPFNGFGFEVQCITTCSEGILVGGNNCIYQSTIENIQKGDLPKKFDLPSCDQLRSIQYNPKNNDALISSSNGSLILFGLETKNSIVIHANHSSSITSVFCRNNIITSCDSLGRIITRAQGETTQSIAFVHDSKLIQSSLSKTISIDIDQTLSFVVCGCSDGCVIITRFTDKADTFKRRVFPNKTAIESVCTILEGNILVAASNQSGICAIQTLKGHSCSRRNLSIPSCYRKHSSLVSSKYNKKLVLISGIGNSNGFVRIVEVPESWINGNSSEKQSIVCDIEVDISKCIAENLPPLARFSSNSEVAICSKLSVDFYGFGSSSVAPPVFTKSVKFADFAPEKILAFSFDCKLIACKIKDGNTIIYDFSTGSSMKLQVPFDYNCTFLNNNLLVSFQNSLILL